MNTTQTVGYTTRTVRVAEAAEYGHPGGGYVIEELIWPIGHDKPFYAIPAWEERGYPDLADVFPTRQAAEAALRDNSTPA